ncbi:unnamed protein product [Amoebophrya sp. A25]|nr:unnamed protein product [Amoebophrya sp. A25]|eukprot:GSA25T00016454001.1
MKLEHLTAVAHNRAGGSRAADLLACASSHLRGIDPWPHIHPAGVGSF